jgi:hypothetical protein
VLLGWRFSLTARATVLRRSPVAPVILLKVEFFDESGDA